MYNTAGVSHQKHAAVVLTAVVVFYIVFSLFNWAPLEEDAYIYFRFVENIAAGDGYVFNPGGEKIEGCSSFTWLFVLVVCKLAGFNILLASKMAGIAFGCLSLIIIHRISRTLISSPALAVLPVALTAISVPFLMRNQMGLDESVYTLVFLALTYTCLSAERFRYWPFLFFLLIISRPEGILTGLALLPVFYLYRDRRSDIIAGVVIVAVLTGMLLLFRLLYFHEFLPSPFYHKVFAGKYYYGLIYAHGFFKDYYAYLLLLPLLFLPFKRLLRNRQTGIVLSFAGIHCLWVILAGACFFPFYRHFVPVIPLLYIMAVSIIAALLPRTSGMPARLLTGCFVVYGFAALVLPQANWVPWDREPSFIAGNMKLFLASPSRYALGLFKHFSDSRYERDNELDMQTRAGMFIRDNYLPGTTFLYDQMGRLPYNAGTEYAFRDTNGLIDRKIGRAVFTLQNSHSSLLGTYDRVSRYLIRAVFPDERFYTDAAALADSILENKPDVIMCCTLMRIPVIDALSRDPRIIKDYALAYYMPTAAILILERRDLEKKEFNNADDIPIVFADRIREHIPDHPWIVAYEQAETH